MNGQGLLAVIDALGNELTQKAGIVDQQARELAQTAAVIAQLQAELADALQKLEAANAHESEA